MKKISTIVDNVFKENTFSASEKKIIYSRINKFIKSLQTSLKKHKILADVLLGGSSAKGTFIKNNFDSDIFVRFNYETYCKFSDELSDILQKPLDEITNRKIDRVHGSRDYFTFNEKGDPNIKFEVIPVLKVDNPSLALNVTDVSPLHVVWAKKYISKKPRYVKDIIATKLFMKHIGVYGAESYIRGFSGHDVDILIFYYGSFEKLLNSSITWGDKEILDIESYYQNEKQVFSTLNSSKIAPLILIDPIQPERNAAASLSKEKIELFKSSALAFLAEPSLSFFVGKKFSLSSLRKKKIVGCKRIIFKVTVLEGKHDVIGSKLLKTYIHIKNKIIASGFHYIESDWFWDKKDYSYFWFFITEESIQNIKDNPTLLHKGPHVKRKSDVKKFRQKHDYVFQDNSFLFTRVKRKFFSVEELLDNILVDSYVLERVKSISISLK